SDALRIIRANQEIARKNGSDPWLFLYREAWLRTLAMDFGGARRVCQTLIDSSVYPTGQAQALGRLAAGFEALGGGADDRARTRFEGGRNPPETPKFFLHWYWRVYALVGAARASLHAGDLVRGRFEADELSRVALATDDRNLHALAWETTAQVAMAELNWAAAEHAVNQALGSFAHLEVPTVAWHVHATASDVYRRLRRRETAAAHHKQALKHIEALVDSFEREEPLRQGVLDARSVRRLREQSLELKL